MKKNQESEKHLFALHCPGLSDTVAIARVGDHLTLDDATLVHRIITILRFGAGQSFILFDRAVHAEVSLFNAVKNKSITVILEEKKNNIILKPEILFFLPLLKKESLETTLYSLTEIGVTDIQLILTQKSQQGWTHKEFERHQKIIIAAAEQSKNFAYPQLRTPVSIRQLNSLIPSDAYRIFFDPQGITIQMGIVPIMKEKKSVALAIGPEGDLIQEEKALLREWGFEFCALTPTILRASQAAAVAAGILRSSLR